MATSKQLHLIATRPHLAARYLTRGELPHGTKPQSPLLDLMRQLPPRDLAALRGVTVDSRLGYTGQRTFATGAQALRWVAPADEVFDNFPAESWRDKRFRQRLYLDDLLACCSGAPEGLKERHRRLCRPSQPKVEG